MIYFDNAATTQPVIAAPKIFYNPSSPHGLGITAERVLREARKTISTALNCAAEEIIFTSGGTESNNIAILGFALVHMKTKAELYAVPHEHPSILAPMQSAAERGWANINTNYNNLLTCTHQGRTLVSISHVNHETGDINDINSIATTIKKNNPQAIIHIDGMQGFCKESANLNNIDIYTFSGHKCHGPAGIGGLWVKKGVRLVPLMYGGGQESGHRPGTENVTGIVQMAEAVKQLQSQLTINHQRVTQVKNIIANLTNKLPETYINAITTNTSPYILNMSFVGIKGEVLVHSLSGKGVHVSMGAACHSKKRTKPALEIMGFPPAIAESAIRFSFSPFNTEEEAASARNIIAEEVTRLRKIMR